MSTFRIKHFLCLSYSIVISKDNSKHFYLKNFASIKKGLIYNNCSIPNTFFKDTFFYVHTMSRNAFYLHAMLGATICFVPTYHARNIFYIQKWPRNFSFLCTITSTHFNILHLAKLSVGNIEKQIQYIKDKTVFTEVHIFHTYISLTGIS